MGLFNNFPWTNFHELNLDWIVKQVKEIQAAFPEGLVGILKGGTGADNAADARANLGIYASEIDMAPDDSRVISLVMGYLEDEIDAVAESINYRIFKTVQGLDLTPGAVSIASTWTAMSSGDVVLCPPDEFAPGSCPESYGSLLLIRSGGNSGACLFFGANHQYRKGFVSNYPTGGWEQVYTNADVVPITSGGTGANNAEDAIRNLGIDFTGTVLSVAGVGANMMGDVPLKLLDTVYTSVQDLNMAPGSAVSAVWGAMSPGTVAVIPMSEVASPPAAGYGIVIIVKEDATNNPGMVIAIDRDSGKCWTMTFSAGSPSGTWNRILNTDSVKLHTIQLPATTYNANGAKSVSVSGEWNGLYPLGVIGVRTGNVNLSAFQFYVSGDRTTVNVGIRNHTSSAISVDAGDLTVTCIYVE